MKIIWLDGARRDLAQISGYLADQDPHLAASAERRIISSVANLETFPEAGRPGRVTVTRELIITGYPYVVVYRVHANQVQILRILHTSQQWLA